MSPLTFWWEEKVANLQRLDDLIVDLKMRKKTGSYCEGAISHFYFSLFIHLTTHSATSSSLKDGLCERAVSQAQTSTNGLKSNIGI